MLLCSWAHAPIEALRRGKRRHWKTLGAISVPPLGTEPSQLPAPGRAWLIALIRAIWETQQTL